MSEVNEPKPDERSKYYSRWFFKELSHLPGYESYEAVVVDCVDARANKWDAKYWADGYHTIGIYNSREEAERVGQIAYDLRLYSDKAERKTP